MGILTCSHGEALCPAGWLGCPAVESGGVSAVLTEKTAPRALTCQTALSLAENQTRLAAPISGKSCRLLWRPDLFRTWAH